MMMLGAYWVCGYRLMSVRLSVCRNQSVGWIKPVRLLHETIHACSILPSQSPHCTSSSRLDVTVFLWCPPLKRTGAGLRAQCKISSQHAPLLSVINCCSFCPWLQAASLPLSHPVINVFIDNRPHTSIIMQPVQRPQRLTAGARWTAPTRAIMPSVTGCCDVLRCVRDQPSNTISYTAPQYRAPSRQISMHIGSFRLRSLLLLLVRVISDWWRLRRINAPHDC